MNLTVDGLTDAILSAHDIETLQAEVRDAMISELLNQSSPEVAESPETIPLQRVG